MSIAVTTYLEPVACSRAGCGITFAVPRGWQRERQEDHTTFYCPNGHQQYFPGETDAERLAKELARERQRLDQAQAAVKDLERSRRAIRGQLTRQRNRIAKGVCPCCKRHFRDLFRHMQTKHPQFAGEGQKEYDHERCVLDTCGESHA